MGWDRSFSCSSPRAPSSSPVDQVKATVGPRFTRSDLEFLAIAGVRLVIAGLAGLAVVVGLARRGHATAALAMGLVTLVIVRSIAIAATPTPLQTDWLDYHTVATQLAGGRGLSCRHGRPAGRCILSILYRIGGPDPLSGELANLAFALGTGILIYDIALRTMGGVAAAAGLYLWAVSPRPGACSSSHSRASTLYTLLFVGAWHSRCVRSVVHGSAGSPSGSPSAWRSTSGPWGSSSSRHS